MKIIRKARTRFIYHDLKCGLVTIDCKVECIHCRSDGTCYRCIGHKWLWGSVNEPGYGFTPYTLTSIYF